MKENDHQIQKGETPKFTNKNLSFDLSLINNTSLMNNNNASDVDQLSFKSDFQVTEANKNEIKIAIIDVDNSNNVSSNCEDQKGNKKFPHLNYVFDFKDDCNITITNNNFKPSLCFYISTFENYIKETESFLMNKYKNDKNKLSNIPIKIHKLKVKMILKLINEIFFDNKEIFFKHRFSRDFNDNIVKKKICYVAQFFIPTSHQDYFENLVKSRYDVDKSGSEKDDTNLLNKDLTGGYLSTLEKLRPDLFLGDTLDYESTEYAKILKETFLDLSYHNIQLYKVFKEVLSNLNINFIIFLKCFCVFLQFSENLHTKLKIIGKELHIEIFCNNESYLKIADHIGYNFELSKYGKTKLLNNDEYINDSDSNKKKDDAVIKEYTRNIYIPYTRNSLNLFSMIDSANDTNVKDIFNDANDTTKLSIFKNVDRIRILNWKLGNCINFKSLKKCLIYKDLTVRRDIEIYSDKSK